MRIKTSYRLSRCATRSSVDSSSYPLLPPEFLGTILRISVQPVVRMKETFSLALIVNTTTTNNNVTATTRMKMIAFVVSRKPSLNLAALLNHFERSNFSLIKNTHKNNIKERDREKKREKSVVMVP